MKALPRAEADVALPQGEQLALKVGGGGQEGFFFQWRWKVQVCPSFATGETGGGQEVGSSLCPGALFVNDQEVA